MNTDHTILLLVEVEEVFQDLIGDLEGRRDNKILDYEHTEYKAKVEILKFALDRLKEKAF